MAFRNNSAKNQMENNKVNTIFADNRKISSGESSGHGFGAFSGVFTPSILTIFGLVMFMLTSSVIGYAGIYYALAILILAQLITLSTGLSISAISTNVPVKGGGAYYLISRALGPGFGSSIGLVLFFAQALSVPFYILGFTGAVTSNFPVLKAYYLEIALATGVILFFITWIGADWAIKFQFVILIILTLSIIAFMGGALAHFSPETFSANIYPLRDTSSVKGAIPKSIPEVFAIFFPAVTGIMAGVNMSGDLKNPAKAIPVGTLAAIITATIVYGLQIVICGGAFSRESLILHPYMVLVKNALFGTAFLVIAGVIVATVSSAIGSFMGAPRVLQALAEDKIIKFLHPFAKGEGTYNEPRRALYLTFVITLITLAWGGMRGIESLSIVASVITMFFLYTYGMVNLAAFVESYGANPSFRPRFKLYHWSTALFGAIACIVVSFIIDPLASIVALIIIGILFIATRRKEMERTFGDATRGFVYSRIRNNLLQLAKMPPDPKNWRPTITVLTGDPNFRFTLLEYACMFECNRGILSLAEIITENNAENIGKKRKEVLAKVNNFIEENELTLFPEVVVTSNFDEGLRVFLQSHSLGPIKPNIVMLGWPKEETRISPFVSHLKTILSLNMSCVILVNKQNRVCPKIAKGPIDVWWRGLHNGSLMLILAYLLSLNPNWENVKLRIIRITSDPDKQKSAYDDLKLLTDSARITVDIKVIVSTEPFDDILVQISKEASVVFLGFLPPEQEKAEEFFATINNRLSEMPPTFLVSSSGEADLLA